MVKRMFMPGDEWLYFKVYCGIKSSNKILLDIIDPVIWSLLLEQIIERWFFVRFSDPDPHLRIRLKLQKCEDIGYVIQVFNSKLKSYFEKGIVWRVELDTYSREIERYGNNTIIFAENIFCADSNLVLSLLKSKLNLELYLWGILKSIDKFLELFEFDLDRKKRYYNLFATSYNKEFNNNNRWISNVKSIYIEKALKPLNAKTNLVEEHESILIAVNQRDSAIELEVKKILELESTSSLEVSVTNFIQSCVHMYYNRAYESYQRRIEAIGYNLGSF